MFTRTVWSWRTAANCACSASISPLRRSCSFRLRSRSPATWALYCEVNSVVSAVVSDTVLTPFLEVTVGELRARGVCEI